MNLDVCKAPRARWHLLDPKPKAQRLDGQMFPAGAVRQRGSRRVPRCWDRVAFDKQEPVERRSPSCCRNWDGWSMTSRYPSMYTGVPHPRARRSTQCTRPPTSGAPSRALDGVWAGDRVPGLPALQSSPIRQACGARRWQLSGGLAPSLLRERSSPARAPQFSIRSAGSSAGRQQEQYISFLEDLNRKHLEQNPASWTREASTQLTNCRRMQSREGGCGPIPRFGNGRPGTIRDLCRKHPLRGRRSSRAPPRGRPSRP